MNLEDRLKEVHDEYLRRMTQGNGTLLQTVEQHLTASVGKMLRPRMLLSAAATRGEEQLHSRRTLLLAVCVEMIHNASLLHDDVVDHAATRRGRPSVNAQWNNEVAVLVGDYLLSQVMQLLDEIGDKDISRKVNQTVMSMVEAELLQQELQNTPCTLSDYLKIIDGKTANLFALAAELGNPFYRDYGLHYGRLFQLRDDIADGEDTPWTQELLHQEETLLDSLPALQ